MCEFLLNELGPTRMIKNEKVGHEVPNLSLVMTSMTFLVTSHYHFFMTKQLIGFYALMIVIFYSRLQLHI